MTQSGQQGRDVAGGHLLGIVWLLQFLSRLVDVGIGLRTTPWPYHWTLRVWSRNRPVGRVVVLNRCGVWWILR